MRLESVRIGGTILNSRIAYFLGPERPMANNLHGSDTLPFAAGAGKCRDARRRNGDRSNLRRREKKSESRWLSQHDKIPRLANRVPLKLEPRVMR